MWQMADNYELSWEINVAGKQEPVVVKMKKIVSWNLVDGSVLYTFDGFSNSFLEQPKCKLKWSASRVQKRDIEFCFFWLKRPLKVSFS